MGKRARALFEADRADFVQRMGDVLQELRSLLQVAEAGAAKGNPKRDT
jgi:hypothetical protein